MKRIKLPCPYYCQVHGDMIEVYKYIYIVLSAKPNLPSINQVSFMKRQELAGEHLARTGAKNKNT